MSASEETGAIRPSTTETTARELAQRLYGLRVKSIEELDSYYDRNYLLKVEPECENTHIGEASADGYVLKVLNAKDSKESKAHVEAEHQVLHILQKAGVNVPAPVLNKHGKDMTLEQISSEDSEDKSKDSAEAKAVPPQQHIVRMLTFIPGIVLHKIPYTPARMYEVGQWLGKLDRSLKNYSHPGLATHFWDLKRHVPQLKTVVHRVKDASRRELATSVLKAFDEKVMPVVDKLPTGVIHGDYTEQNIIFNEESDGQGYALKGIIDFGDMVNTCYVFDVSIAIVHTMTDTSLIHPLDVPGHVLAGYLTEMELNELEWGVLYECIAGRLLVAPLIGYMFDQDPENDEYMLQWANKGWVNLEIMWKVPKEELHKRWKDIIQSHSK